MIEIGNVVWCYMYAGGDRVVTCPECGGSKELVKGEGGEVVKCWWCLDGYNYPKFGLFMGILVGRIVELDWEGRPCTKCSVLMGIEGCHNFCVCDIAEEHVFGDKEEGVKFLCEASVVDDRCAEREELRKEHGTLQGRRSV